MDYSKYIGKVVVTRGTGSGVNAGRLVAFEDKVAILTDSYYCRNWKFNNSFGSMHSLANGDIVGGDNIAKVMNDVIIVDVNTIVIAVDDLLEKIKTFAK